MPRLWRALTETFVDLGMSPLCESYLTREQLDDAETFFPLHVYVCGRCFLVQLREYVSPETIFTEYAYASSYSDSWLRHASDYVDMILPRLGLGPQSRVVEIASNDGYLLQYFVARGIPVVGVEPASNIAAAASQKGIPTVVRFFGQQTARELVTEGGHADLIVANNVLAQVPDLIDFISGMKRLLAADGCLTLEVPHLVRLVEGNQFDTIYHEHYSYFSFTTTKQLFAAQGLTIFDVEELPTHGGSLRIFARHEEHSALPVSPQVNDLADRERALGVTRLEFYRGFAARVREAKRKLLSALIEAKDAGKTVAGYGAPGKGNTLLNYCGIRTDLLEYTVDRNPCKQGRFLPGTHIPIWHPDRIRETRPDYVLILPWNLEREIVAQLAYIRDWGGQFLVPIPEVRVLP